jgi:hypothetical protein
VQRHLHTLARWSAALLAAAGLSCSESINDSPVANATPRSFLWLFPDSTIGTGVSRQHLRWWGEDPDGLVQGYLFAYAATQGRVTAFPQPDTLRYSFVTRNDSVFAFPLDTLFRYYTVYVRSLDNTAPRPPAGVTIRLGNEPYLDRNDNGSFDAGDERLPGLNGGLDPRGALLTFPIRNTRPTAAFSRNPNDPSVPLKQPDTTFTAITFSWTSTDPDGDNTLTGYRIALNDTTDPNRWFDVPMRDTIVTLFVPRLRSDGATGEVSADVYSGKFVGRRLLGTMPGLRLDAQNVLYLQVRDVAGEYSPTVRLPAGNDRWFVKKPAGRLLLVSDYIRPDAAQALNAYRTSLAAVPGGQFTVVDQLDIGRGLTPDEKRSGKFGPNVPPFADPALVWTFLLYDYVLWYTEEFPSLSVAQVTLFTYLQNGGKVIFSTTFESSVDPRGALRDFAPIDSISSVDLSTTRPPVPPAVAGDTRIPANFLVQPDSSNPQDIYPLLAFNSAPAIHLIFMRPIYRRADARYVYRLQADSRGRYLGRPDVAVVDGQRTIVFFGLPVHLLDNTTLGAGMTGLFTRLFGREFSARQRVDRRRF